MTARSALTLGALLLAASTISAAATTVTDLSVRADCEGSQTNVTHGAGPIQDQVASVGSACSSAAFARAGAGYVGAAATVTGKAGAGSAAGSARAIAGATARYDISFLVPLGYTGGLIPVSVNFSYDGFLNSAPDTLNLGNLTATALFDGYFELRGHSTPLTVVGDKVDIGDSLRRTATAGATGTAVVLGVAVNSVTNTILINPLLGATLIMNLQANAATAYDATARSSAESSFYDTLSLAGSGPVFNLPDGFSVMSADAGIVDNAWVDPRGPAAPVPLPAGFLLLLSGGLVLRAIGGRARRDG